MHQYVNLARDLRKRSTEAEASLWTYLRDRKLAGYKFKRQAPIDKYIVDFLCIYKKLIIELDGYHHINLNAEHKFRTQRLEILGFSVLRFWNDDVLHKRLEVLKAITERLGLPP